MVYTQKEKQKIDNLLMVFGDYLAANKNVDIAYSEKSGYVRLIIDDVQTRFSSKWKALIICWKCFSMMFCPMR